MRAPLLFGTTYMLLQLLLLLMRYTPFAIVICCGHGSNINIQTSITISRDLLL
ncbi:hypothetical protein OIDMADRAFT_19931 [Oidiodendron maius Zn]|uniref:Uncharacterized protein n=1 Tax=Oidiodendron maius (strain Zn) TaxID=913774 RepID=A0A0C3H9B6_OIDMZ|nr:hypothetical protein OIDMADRAFT_19931 [Oidiodendron maius Zn]